jgi:erythromycin esterase-like protein
MAITDNQQVVKQLRQVAHPLTGKATDYDPLIELIGDARLVLLGEASHGTHEFYRERARITQRLIEERGFVAVAVEADWPDAYRVNRYLHGRGGDTSAFAALRDFGRFPTWMWRNVDVLDFIDVLRARNANLPPGVRKTGFYGIDLYSLRASLDAVVHYLDQVDPEAALRARSRYSCFDHFGQDPQFYGYVAGQGMGDSCENEVVEQLNELQRRVTEYAQRDGDLAEDEFFFAEQNARLARNAEEYYRAMFRGRHSSWNLRDTHMAETIDALLAHLDRHGDRSKLVVWAHNSHLGDARATEMGASGELNLGQLIRERYGTQAVLVGFTTYRGTVTAASDWDQPPQQKQVRPGLPGSYETLFHEVEIPDFLLRLRDDELLADALRSPRLQRAIGVIYRPETERQSHYFHARLGDQFDALLHFDATTAVVPLEQGRAKAAPDMPETYPSGV